jgi:hypothetical protein
LTVSGSRRALEPIFEADLPSERTPTVGRNAQQAVVEVEELLVELDPRSRTV